ncbi:MAG: N-acetylmuramoyl-L-alanine amidase [Fimbriimonadaceae bacterium]|nr:N-acetylmuramoyl-L-alanine amidase [Fimbriimonadaceae bacterium]
MKRFLLLLIPWMVMASTASAAQIRSAEVVFTHFGAISERAIRVADECYVPLTFLAKVGWKYTVKNSSVAIEAEPRGARVPIREFELGPAIPLRMALEQMGAETFWEPDNDKLQVCSPVTKIEVSGNKVQIETHLTTRPRVFRLTGPNRFVVDIPGARLTRDTVQQIEGNGVRVSQIELNTVRVAFEPGYRPSLPVIPGLGTSFKWELDPDEDPGTPDEPPAPPPVKVEPVVKVAPDPNLGPKTVAGPLTLDLESSNRVMVSLKLSGILGKPAQFRRPEPDVLEIVLWNTQVSVPDSASFNSASITDISVRDEGPNAILALKLARPMGVELSPGLTNLGIVLMKPNVGDGKLAGKVVVVDAGHGGHDSGAKSPLNDAFEKNLTLKIAKQLSERLANEGATVIMTRKTDVFIELKERAEIANRNQANFFISCHINSNKLSNSTSGGITFYHKDDPIGQLLADCIQREIGKVSGLKSIGTWSDGRIYESGFSVLRNSKMPAVLVEFGFINHNVDRKRMMTDDFQRDVASAIVKGLKVYLGDGN